MGTPQRGDNTRKGGTTCGVPRVIPPHPCPPSSVVSPRRVGQHVVSPVSSPLTHVIPPSVWCLPGGWDNMWYPPCHPPSLVSSPLARVIPPFSVVSPRRVGQHVISPCVVPPPSASSSPPVWCLPGGWDNMWCPPCHLPRPRHPPFSVVSPRRVGQHVVSLFVVPLPRRPPSPALSPLCVVPPLWCPRALSPLPRHPPSPASSPLVISRDMSSPRCFK